MEIGVRQRDESRPDDHGPLPGECQPRRELPSQDGRLSKGDIKTPLRVLKDSLPQGSSRNDLLNDKYRNIGVRQWDESRPDDHGPPPGECQPRRQLPVKMAGSAKVILKPLYDYLKIPFHKDQVAMRISLVTSTETEREGTLFIQMDFSTYVVNYPGKSSFAEFFNTIVKVDVPRNEQKMYLIKRSELQERYALFIRGLDEPVTSNVNIGRHLGNFGIKCSTKIRSRGKQVRYYSWVPKAWPQIGKKNVVVYRFRIGFIKNDWTVMDLEGAG